MIDENCVIYRQGKGFCWCPSSAWNLTDEELCQLCQVKNAQVINNLKFIKISQGKTLSAKQK